jgi:hypothetical protein
MSGIEHPLTNTNNRCTLSTGAERKASEEGSRSSPPVRRSQWLERCAEEQRARMGLRLLRQRLHRIDLVHTENPGNHAKQIHRTVDRCPH